MLLNEWPNDANLVVGGDHILNIMDGNGMLFGKKQPGKDS